MSVETVRAMNTFESIEKSNTLMSFANLVWERLNKKEDTKIDWHSIPFDVQLSAKLEDIEVVSHVWHNSGLRFIMELYNYKESPLFALLITVGQKSVRNEELTGYGQGLTLESMHIVKIQIEKAVVECNASKGLV